MQESRRLKTVKIDFDIFSALLRQVERKFEFVTPLPENAKLVSCYSDAWAATSASIVIAMFECEDWPIVPEHEEIPMFGVIIKNSERAPSPPPMIEAPAVVKLPDGSFTFTETLDGWSSSFTGPTAEAVIALRRKLMDAEAFDKATKGKRPIT